MSKELVPSIVHGALTRADPRRLALFQKTVGKNLSKERGEIDQALEWCEIYQANPFVNDIYFFVFDAKNDAKRRVVPVLSIAKYRKIADAAGNYRPDNRPPRFTYDETLKSPANPRGIVDCTVSAFKYSHGEWHEVSERVRWDERVPLKDHCEAGWDWVNTGEVWEDSKKPIYKRAPRGPVIQIIDPAKEAWIRMPETMISKCYDEETEVLTTNGFRLFSEVGDSLIMQVTPSGLEPVGATPFFQKYAGDMVVMDGDKNLNFCVTPNHDMVVLGGKIEAMDLYAAARTRAAHCIPRIAPGRSVEFGVSDAAIRLAAAVLCDGSGRGGEKFTVSVSRPRKIDRLMSYGLHTSLRTRASSGDIGVMADGRVVTTLSDKSVFSFMVSSVEGLLDGSKFPNTEVFAQLSERQSRIFIEEMVFFDGNIDPASGVSRFFQTKPTVTALFELVACAAGFCVSSTERSDATYPGAKVLTISDRNAIPIRRWCRPYKNFKPGIKRVGLELTPNPGRGVWCVTVPSGAIVVRRKSFSMVCGNCTDAAVIRKGWPNETSGSFVPEDLDAAHTLELTATEIIEDYETNRKLARAGRKDAVVVSWGDGTLESIPAGQFADRVLGWAKSPGRTVQEMVAWWNNNHIARTDFKALNGSDYLELQRQYERIDEELTNAERTTKGSG